MVISDTGVLGTYRKGACSHESEFSIHVSKFAAKLKAVYVYVLWDGV